MRSQEQITLEAMRALYTEPDIQSHFGNPDRNIDRKDLCDWELSLLREYVDEHAHILDVGCAGGQEAFAFLRAGYRVTGIDIVPEFIDAARRLARDTGFEGRARFELVQGFDWPVDDEVVDGVCMMTNFLMHLPTREIRGRVFQECYRVLRPGGAVMMEGPDRTHPGRHLERPSWEPERPEDTAKKTEWGLTDEPGAVVAYFHPCKGDVNAKTLAPTYAVDPREIWEEVEICGLRVVRVDASPDAKERGASVTIVAVKDECIDQTRNAL